MTPRGGVSLRARSDGEKPLARGGLTSLEAGNPPYLGRGGDASLSRFAGGRGERLPRLPAGEMSRGRFKGRGDRSLRFLAGDQLPKLGSSLYPSRGGPGL